MPFLRGTRYAVQAAGAAVASAFTPWVDANLDAYFQAGQQNFSDAGTTSITDGGTLHRANNLVDNGATLNMNQGTLGNKAVYTANSGKPYWTFNGSKFYDSLTLFATGDFFSTMLIRFTALGYYNIYDNATSIPMLWVDGSGRLEPDTRTGTSAANDGNWHKVHVWTQRGADRCVLWLDGTKAYDSNGGGVFAGTPVLSLFNRGGASAYQGDCAAFGLSHNHDFTAAEALVPLLDAHYARLI